ncbi:MAG: hypothetical protein NTX77_08720 [Actinobacteria bacterium]|nr:hypothetical protein [Actinomycetota bacterium]
MVWGERVPGAALSGGVAFLPRSFVFSEAAKAVDAITTIAIVINTWFSRTRRVPHLLT